MAPSSPAPRDAHGQWASLNPRQQRYLMVLYELDHQAEQEQQNRWYQKLPREPAKTWRWIPYATRSPLANPTPAQQLLEADGLRDPGAGATLAALARRGLILLRDIDIGSTEGQSLQTQIRLTKLGRSTARATQPAPPTSNAQPLPAWLMEALTTVARAGPDGLPKYEISRAAARRRGPRGLRLIEQGQAWSYHLTVAGIALLKNSPPSTQQER